jgi:hypothetical protein
MHSVALCEVHDLHIVYLDSTELRYPHYIPSTLACPPRSSHIVYRELQMSVIYTKNTMFVKGIQIV